ncbi:MAG: hypothetical protein JEZ00_09945 [Anaerolineaceae bacterium]|nr:hypothetical protein [Anaerolineaceae bacterium]
MIQKLILHWKKLTFSSRWTPWFILLISVLSFGLLIPWFGFSWDDWAFVWISHHFGAEGLARYFSTNRPVWGVFYQISTSLLGDAPWQWQIFSMLSRWASALLLWLLMRALWPKRQHMAIWAALIFLVYPGFRQQAIAITYGHFYLVYSAFIGSLLCMVLAYRNPQRFAIFTGCSLLLSAVNLYSMEYFFTLEAIRPIILYGLLHSDREDKKLGSLLKIWAPYALILISSVIWRVFLFPYQTQNYKPLFLQTLQSNPLLAFWQLVQQIAHDLYWTSVLGISRAFHLPDVQSFGKLSTIMYAGIVTVVSLLCLIYLQKYLGLQFEIKKKKQTIWVILLGLLTALMAGWPFWFTNLPIGLEYPNSRFTIPFILGIAIFWAGIFELMPLPKWLRNTILSIWVAFAVGQQFISANDFRRDWEVQQQLFWQLSWRIPELKPGTTVLINDLPIQYASDNSLTAPLNWLYVQEVRQEEMDYLFTYPSIRLGASIPSYERGTSIQENYLAAMFNGSTENMLSIYFQPPGCLRVLDPMVDNYNSLLPPTLRETIPYSNLQQIIIDGAFQAEPPHVIFRTEPQHRWCYYYQKAELARQQEDWSTVTDLGDIAFTLGDYPNDPTERFPFVEGYAHIGNWQQALTLSNESAAISDLVHPMICRLWQRIELETADSIQKTDTILSVQSELNCNP